MPIILSDADDDLLRRRFSIADPTSLKNLVPKVPPDPSAELEFEYDVRPFVKCAHCGRLHGKGFVMKLQNGLRFLTGKDCGSKIYHLDFYEIEKTFERGKTRQYDLYRVITCLPFLEPLGVALQHLAEDDRFVKLAQVQTLLREAMPELYHLLKATADRQDHELVVFEVIMDEQAMRARAASNKEAREQLAAMTVTERKRLRQAGRLPEVVDESQPITRRVQKAIVNLEGITLFRKPVEGRVEHIAGCGRLAQMMHNALDGQHSSDLSNARLDDACRKFQGLIEKVENIHRDLQDVAAFFNSPHLQKIAEWASNTPECDGEYSAIDGGLIFSVRGGDADPIVVGLPKNFEMPGLECLELLRRQLAVPLLAAA